jgi:hypothetical protein
VVYFASASCFSADQNGGYWNMNVKLIRAGLADSEKLLEIQKICFAPHLERYLPEYQGKGIG